MRITFIHSCINTTVSYSHAIASLAGVILKSYPEIELCVVTLTQREFQNSIEEIVGTKPDILLFSSMSSQWHYQLSLAKELRYVCNSSIFVCGGIHITARPDSNLQNSFDIVVIGEGENAIDEILREAKKMLDSNSSSKSVSRITGSPVKDLSQLPIPVFELFPKEILVSYPSLIFSRGCPYKCNYCMSRLGGVSGTIRWKSVDQAIREILKFIEVSSAKELYFDDDTILKNPKWIMEFCHEYKEQVSLPFFCNARPETVKPKLVKYLKEAGCSAIGIGIESGSEKIRKSLGRPMSDEKIISAFRIAHNAGLQTWSFNMVGLPGESLEDFERTKILNDLAQVDDIRISVFTPYPGSPMGADVDVGQDGYFRSANELPDEIRNSYVDWVLKLEDEGRLWLTSSEKDILLGCLN